MSFIETIKEKARNSIKTIVLPEAEDIRTLEAAETALKEQYAKIVLLGNEENIKTKALENDLDISKAIIINPTDSEKYDEYVNLLFELRSKKGNLKIQITFDKHHSTREVISIPFGFLIFDLSAEPLIDLISVITDSRLPIFSILTGLLPES